MRALCIAAWLTVSCAAAQTFISPARLARLRPQFTRQPDEARLACDVKGMRPELDLAFRFGTGYSLTVPLKQFNGPGHQIATMIRITPQGGSPVYLGSRLFLPPIPKTNSDMRAGGAFLVGQGKYRVDFVAYDDQDRTCRAGWDINAELNHAQRNIKPAVPPGVVAEISGRGLPPASNARDDAAPFSLTVLLQAAPVTLRRATFLPRDRVRLLAALSTLLNRMPVTRVRLVVFNLDQQRELYRQDNFDLSAISDVSQAISQLNLMKVDYAVLKNRTGDKDLLSELLQSEADSPNPSDAIVFLGPYTREARVTPEASALAALPRCFYFVMESPFAPPPPFPDLIAKAVTRTKGRVVPVRTAADFAAAMTQVERAAVQPRSETRPRD